jgi:RNA polymerase sigma factor (sigma-70 family)
LSHTVLTTESEALSQIDAHGESASTPALALSPELFDTYFPPISRYLERNYREIDGPQTAFDSLLEVAEYAVKKPVQCVRALVMCVAKRKANRARDRAWREESQSEPQEALSASHEEDMSERFALMMALKDALASLSEEDRAIFLAHYVEEFELAEIAVHFRLSVSAVKSRLFRARRLLKSHPGLAEYCPVTEKGASGDV